MSFKVRIYLFDYQYGIISYMKIRKYICDKCGVGGIVSFGDHEEAISIFNKIMNDHLLHAPGCQASRNEIKVLSETD
jgi:hypothetical protein